MTERRQHERWELPAQVELQHGGALQTLAAINISAGGVLLRNDSNVPFTVGERIRIRFDVPDLAPAFAMDAKVVRVIEATSKPAALAALWSSSDAAANASLAQMLWSLKGRGADS
jgi:hypothetical protein